VLIGFIIIFRSKSLQKKEEKKSRELQLELEFLKQQEEMSRTFFEMNGIPTPPQVFPSFSVANSMAADRKEKQKKYKTMSVVGWIIVFCTVAIFMAMILRPLILLGLIKILNIFV
jgi:hypothetical protein